MKVISDIRVYKSIIDNIEENPLPGSMGNKLLNVVIHRIVMKLWVSQKRYQQYMEEHQDK